MSPFSTHKHVDPMLINFKVGGWRLVNEKKKMKQVLFFLLSFQRKNKSLITDKDLIKGSNVYLYFLQNAGSLRVDCRQSTYILYRRAWQVDSFWVINNVKA